MDPISKNILIIEDEEPVAKVLRDKLKNAGYNVQFFLTASEALGALKKDNFNLIILDIILPNMDGFQFLEEIKKRNINVPVIVTSNLGSEEDMEKAKSLGAKYYIVKAETTMDEMANRIKRFLENG